MSNEQDKNSSDLRPETKQKEGGKPQLPSYRRGPFSWLLIAIIIFTVMILVQQWQGAYEIPLSEFIEHVKTGRVEEVTMKETELVGKFTDEYVTQKMFLLLF